MPLSPAEGLLILVALCFCALYLASAVWAYRDAEQRGKSGVLVLLVTLVAWPLGLIGWLLVRPAEAR